MNWERYAGMATMIGIVLILTISLWLGIAGPIWRASWTATPDQWLGFVGSILGGLATLLAAIIAWFAVQAQIKETRRIGERHRSDAADVRLTEYSSTIFKARSEQHQILIAKDDDRELKYQEFEKFRTSPQVLAALTDPLLGKYVEAVAYFMNALRNDAMAFVGKVELAKVGHIKTVLDPLHRDLHNMIEQRRTLMRADNVDALHLVRFIKLAKYRRMVADGGIPMDKLGDSD